MKYNFCIMCVELKDLYHVSKDLLHLLLILPSAVGVEVPPELFVAPAKQEEINRVLNVLSIDKYQGHENFATLDLVAVSSIVLGALTSAPLLSVDEAATLLGPFIQRDKPYVRISVAHHALSRIPNDRKLILRDLMRVLCLVERSSGICNAASLAKAVGPVLFRPEKQSISKSVGALTVGSIACTRMLIE